MKNLSLAQSLRKEEIQSKHGSLAGLRRGAPTMKLHPTQRVCQSLAIESLSKEMERRRRGGPSFKHILDRHLFLRLANGAGQWSRQKLIP